MLWTTIAPVAPCLQEVPEMSPAKPNADAAVDERATDWIDNRLEAEDQAAFEAAIAADPELAASTRDLEEVVRTLRTLPIEDAPDDFLRAVQSRIRRRSRGRHFGVAVGFRFPYEAIISGLLIFLLVIVYMMSMPPTTDGVMTDAPKQTSEASKTFDAPSWGAVASDDDDFVVIDVAVEKLAALETAIASNLAVLQEGTPTASPKGDGWRRVRLRKLIRKLP
ncbi:MAG: hypothetical protein ACI9MR_003196 [Myxococcota bacterium]|jgi:hypothetical protein